MQLRTSEPLISSMHHAVKVIGQGQGRGRSIVGTPPTAVLLVLLPRCNRPMGRVPSSFGHHGDHVYSVRSNSCKPAVILRQTSLLNLGGDGKNKGLGRHGCAWVKMGRSSPPCSCVPPSRSTLRRRDSGARRAAASRSQTPPTLLRSPADLAAFSAHFRAPSTGNGLTDRGPVCRADSRNEPEEITYHTEWT